MKRTTIMLPEELKAQAERRAFERGISLGELVRESVESALASGEEERRSEDPLFADDTRFEGSVPSHLAERHDDYLYRTNRKKS